MESVILECVNVRFMPAGLLVNPSNPHLGATLDGVVCCNCCGEGIIEIKSWYKPRDVHSQDVKYSYMYLYLNRNQDGELQLRLNHEYYLQTQGQLAVCEKEY